MRTIAEIIMRGRVQAGAVALLGTLLPLIAPAVVALVTLRKGAIEGTLILLIALLPTLLTFSNNEGRPLVFVSTVFGLIAVYISSLVLRQISSWCWAIMVLLVVSVMAALLTKQLVPASLSYLIDSLTEAMTVQTTAAGIDSPSMSITPSSITGLLAVIVILNGVCSLCLGRWWQSLLYNPGGFGKEFCQLKLGAIATTICLVASAYFLVQGDAYFTWSFVFALPLILVAIAIVHTVVRSSTNAKKWLIIFYVTVVVLSISQLTNYVQIALMSVGFLDNWLNFRGYNKSQST